MTSASAPEKIESEADWRGEELAQRDDWIVQLSDGERGEIAGALERVGALDIDDVKVRTFSLPTVGSLFRRIQSRLEYGSGACLVKGLDLTQWSEREATKVFWALSQYVGTPVSQSAKGERLFSVRNEGFKEDDPRARGPNTRKKLSFHTDRCDVIAFFCLQQARSGGENEIVSSVALYNEIARRRPDLLEVLRQPFLYKRHTVDSGNDQPYCRQPIFSFCEGDFACAFLRVLIERASADPDTPDMTSEQREALDFLEEVAGEPGMHYRFLQEPGDLLFLNNWTTLHRRTEFEDHEELDLWRHILRVWLSVPNSRPLDPAFLDNYGAVEAGAIRGGMRAAE